MRSGRSPIVQRRGSGRQARSIRNDERLLDAALTLADEAGWGAMMLAPVAERADLSRMTAKARFHDRSDLGAALWSQTVAPPFTTALESVIAIAAEGSQPNAAALQAALQPFVEPDLTMRAAAELLLVGRYDPAVKHAIGASLDPLFTQWLAVRGSSKTRTTAARNAYLLILALGLLTHGRRSPVSSASLVSEYESLCEALMANAVPGKLPPDRLHHVDGPIDFGTGDPAWESLLQATIDQVGRLGYDAATIDVITDAAHCSRGLLFGRYETKWDLFLDASARMLESSINANYEYLRRLSEEYGAGVAEAAIIREFMAPNRGPARTVALEQSRLSWHNEEWLAKVSVSYAESVRELEEKHADRPHAELVAHVHAGLALGMGVMILADLYPTAWKLPMDVVTVPLLDGRH